jgi:hypothetical protein
VTCVLAPTAFQQRRTGQIGQSKRVVQFAVSDQAGVGGDLATMEFQPQAAVEIDPQRPVIRFTRGCSIQVLPISHNRLIFMTDSPTEYKENRCHPGNPGLYGIWAFCLV